MIEVIMMKSKEKKNTAIVRVLQNTPSISLDEEIGLLVKECPQREIFYGEYSYQAIKKIMKEENVKDWYGLKKVIKAKYDDYYRQMLQTPAAFGKFRPEMDESATKGL